MYASFNYMKRFAVGWYDQFDNTLAIKIVFAEDWKDAILEATGEGFEECEALEEAKRHAFDCDAGLDVVEIPDPVTDTQD